MLTPCWTRRVAKVCLRSWNRKFSILVGALAWNRQKHPQGRQPREYFSGVVGHLIHGRTHISDYGPTPQACKLLDGLFLAVNTEKILAAEVMFYPQFDFHFYDLDFCRQCLGRALRLGTWPIAVTHGSRGAYNSPEWKAKRDLYLNKWRQPDLNRRIPVL